MDLERAETLAKYYINLHKIDQCGYSFRFGKTKRAIGRCFERQRIIELSAFHISKLSEEEVKNTILHEIAHALVGCHNNHNYIWQRKAIEIGCNGKRCAKSGNTESRFIGKCQKCPQTYSRFRYTPSLEGDFWKCRCSGKVLWYEGERQLTKIKPINKIMEVLNGN